MTIALISALVAVNVAYLILLDRTHARADRERQMLLQRIQAPEAAVIEHATAFAGPDDTAPVDEHDLDPEEREAIERMEAIERNAAPWLS